MQFWELWFPGIVKNWLTPGFLIFYVLFSVTYFFLFYFAFREAFWYLLQRGHRHWLLTTDSLCALPRLRGCTSANADISWHRSPWHYARLQRLSCTFLVDYLHTAFYFEMKGTTTLLFMPWSTPLPRYPRHRNGTHMNVIASYIKCQHPVMGLSG